jgi:hypothetical protein
MTEINSKMLYTIANIIETFPENHNQDTWVSCNFYLNDDNISSVIYDGNQFSCGTTQCVAGWAVIIENGGLKHQHPDGSLEFNNGNSLELSEGSYTDLAYVYAGAEILGLEVDDARTLFMTTDIENYEAFDMPRVLREIADGATVDEAVNSAWLRHNKWWDDTHG